MTAATTVAAGTAGLVPAPAAGAIGVTGRFLCADKAWRVPQGTTYGNASTAAAGLITTAQFTRLYNIGKLYSFSGFSGITNSVTYMSYLDNLEKGRYLVFVKLDMPADVEDTVYFTASKTSETLGNNPTCVVCSISHRSNTGTEITIIDITNSTDKIFINTKATNGVYTDGIRVYARAIKLYGT